MARPVPALYTHGMRDRLRRLGQRVKRGVKRARGSSDEQLQSIDREHRFRFECHLGVSCLNACCTDMQLPLTPYDVLRLRQALDLDSETFLERHADIEILAETGIPLVQLRMRAERQGLCEWATDTGCLVYAHRPGVCRAYPLGRSAIVNAQGQMQEHLYLQRDPVCEGFASQRRWSAPELLRDQGLAAYLEIGDLYAALVGRIRAGGRALAEPQREAMLTALYRLDAFAELIEARRILSQYRVPTARRRKIRSNEEQRLRFAFEWLDTALIAPSLKDMLAPESP